MPAPISDSKRNRIATALARGTPVARIAERVGVSPDTVYRVRAAIPFTPGPQSQPVVPPPIISDQAPPPPNPVEFRPGYHDHTFRSFAEPIAFCGWTLERARAAVDQHQIGYFYLSWALSMTTVKFGPVLAALGQRVAPILALPRVVHGGPSGLARMLAEEVRHVYAARAGLLPTPYFPTTLWGATAIEKAFMGFSVWQHVFGEPDYRGVRPMYTRLWPSWAVQRYPGQRKFVAMTDEGPIDIITGDGKFTLIEDVDSPHLFGAIVPLAEEALDGKFTQRSRASLINKYGDPKWIGEMPPNVGTETPEGDRLFAALATIRGPDGFGMLPNGAKMKPEAIPIGQTDLFKTALDSNKDFVAAIFLGSNGTMTTGTGGVYTSPTFQGVARTNVDRDLQAIVRGVNQGAIGPWAQINFGASIAEAKLTGEWTEPVIDIPLPDPDSDVRYKSIAERRAALTKQIEDERKAGCEMTQEIVNRLSEEYGVDEPPVIAMAAQAPHALDLAPTDLAKVVRVDEARASRQLPPIGDERGQLTIAELEALAKQSAATGESAEEEGAKDAQGTATPANAPTSTPPQARYPRSRRFAASVADASRLTFIAAKDSVKFYEPKRHATYDRDNYTCAYCKYHDETATGKNLTLDHIRSRNRGGDAQAGATTPATNLITSCGTCNFSKQDKTEKQLHLAWEAKGTIPPPIDWNAIRAQARQPIDLDVGAKQAERARAYRDSGGTILTERHLSVKNVKKTKGKPKEEDNEKEKKDGPGVQHDPSNGQFAPGGG